MRNFCTLIFFLSMTHYVSGQVNFNARVDSTSMLIGDQQNLTLTFVSPSSQDKAELHTEYLDTCSFLDIISQTPWLKSELNNQSTLEKRLRFSIFEAGDYTIPSLYAILGSDTLHTYLIPLIIQGIEPDSTGLLPIKGIIQEKSKWTDYLAWIIGVLSLLVAYGLYRYLQYKKKSKMIEAVIEVPVVIPPHEIALQKLYALKESKLWEKGEVKEYHVQLTFILREYLEHRYGIPALESTSHEILRDIRSLSLKEHVSTIDEILNIADWVKFAKGIPEENVNALALDRTIDLVESTKPLLTTETNTAD